MSEIFSNVPVIKYEGPDSKNPFAFKYYDPEKVILGQKIRKGETTLEELADRAAELKAPKNPISGQQEYLESVLNNIVLSGIK